MTSDSEAERIKREYARRDREIPDRFYGWERPANLLAHQEVAQEGIRQLCQAGHFPLTGRRVLDVGCGSASWLLEFVQWGANPIDLAGIDLIAERIETAKARIPSADLLLGPATALPWPDGSFDVVSQFTVFTSILAADVKRLCAAEMLRVLKPGGLVLWYDFRFNNPRNSQVKGIGQRELRSLFAPCSVSLTTITLAPPIARLVAPRSWLLALMLRKIPILCSHYLAVIRKPS